MHRFATLSARAAATTATAWLAAARCDEKEVFTIFLDVDGRPHWGKANCQTGEQRAKQHARWDDWWRVRDSVDPKGTFLNPYMRSIRP